MPLSDLFLGAGACRNSLRFCRSPLGTGLTFMLSDSRAKSAAGVLQSSGAGVLRQCLDLC